MNRLAPSREFCHRCDRETLWELLRGGRRLRCTGCGALFPCRSERCGHVDCDEARAPAPSNGRRTS